MDMEGFRRFLSRKGKQEHVIAGLMAQVEGFAAHLAARRTAPDAATEQDVRDYAGEDRAKLRALALYFAFAGNRALAATASGLRESGIAKTRRLFPLRDFRGVQPDHVTRLEAAGIGNVAQMLAAGATPAARARLAAETGIPSEAILEFVKLSDLSRLAGLKGVRARLYYDAGVDTVEKLAAWEPEALQAMLAEWVARTGFDGIAPLPKEVRNGIAAARRLPKVVEYE